MTRGKETPAFLRQILEDDLTYGIKRPIDQIINLPKRRKHRPDKKQLPPETKHLP